ncbi:MAG: cyclophilin-like fold protein [bacterium]
MAKKIRITVDNIKLDAELNDTKTAQKIWDALPIEAKGNLWGEEIYFSIPIKAGKEKPQDVVERGDLAYWEPGSAFCIFYGPTPASYGDEVRPASAVTVFGRITGDYSTLKKVKGSPKVKIERAE